MNFRVIYIAIALMWTGLCAVAFAQDAVAVPATADSSRILRESFCYSATVDRTYVVGFAPRISSRFLNPRTPPTGFEGLATPHYRPFPGLRGWYFCSPSGYTTGAPEGSDAHAYLTGNLGITDNLALGYPNGKRVVEPVLVPVSAASRPGGFLIQGAPTQVKLAADGCQPDRPKSPAKPSKPVEK